MGRMGARCPAAREFHMGFFLCDDMMLSVACEMLSWTASHLGRSLIIAMILLGKD
jgi:hypothetical protein